MMAPLAGGPLVPVLGIGGASILNPAAFRGGGPIGPGSLFNIGGAPISVFGGLFTAGQPLAGPIGQIFRGGAPQPFTNFGYTLAAGPIGTFLVGRGGIDLQFGPTALYFNLPEALGPVPFAPASILATPLERPSELVGF
jgi:hypothetical protein